MNSRHKTGTAEKARSGTFKAIHSQHADINLHMSKTVARISLRS